MEVKNLKSGEIETLSYDIAIGAVEAGTHAHVNRDEGGEPKDDKTKAKPVEKK